MQVDDPVAAYQQQADELAARALQARNQVAAIHPSVRSDDGAVTVTVNATGALAGIEFGDSARDLALTDLSALIMRTAQTARVRAAKQTQEALISLVGESGAAVQYIRSQLPALSESEPDHSSGAAAVRRPFTDDGSDGGSDDAGTDDGFTGRGF